MPTEPLLRGTQVGILLIAVAALGAAEGRVEVDHRTHQDAASGHAGPPPPAVEDPALPPGMDLEQTLERAARPAPEGWPDPIIDDATYAWLLAEKMEYRIPDDSTPAHAGWELQGWIGRDISKFWFTHEGEWIPEDDSGETETDLLYSRLVSPFWQAQLGLRYANEWRTGQDDDYEDLISGVVGLQGMAPYQVELDIAVVVTEDSDVSLEFEAEYDLRLTQRLVLQPLVETAVHAQDVKEREVEAGINEIVADLRLRYEISRRFAPYLGLRSRQVVGAARGDTEDDEETLALLGLRWAW